ncbi:hypothetical protein PUN28_009658 [Cardiocondyla obscurior]|uniref:Uncharacterized protein n=1 Tax=Cardiocondyla obscurior TaxID=286306 RepID=A0AAW2FZ22_9HYME
METACYRRIRSRGEKRFEKAFENQSRTALFPARSSRGVERTRKTQRAGLPRREQADVERNVSWAHRVRYDVAGDRDSCRPVGDAHASVGARAPGIQPYQRAESRASSPLVSSLHFFEHCATARARASSLANSLACVRICTSTRERPRVSFVKFAEKRPHKNYARVTPARTSNVRRAFDERRVEKSLLNRFEKRRTRCRRNGRQA